MQESIDWEASIRGLEWGKGGSLVVLLYKSKGGEKLRQNLIEIICNINFWSIIRKVLGRIIIRNGMIPND